jgi:hypothetical protein
MSRLIPLPVEHDEHAKRLQHDYQNDVASGIREDLDAIEDEQTLICREIFRILTDKPLDVIIPFAHEIDWPEIEFKNTRNYNVFLDLIKLCAIFEQRNRTIDDKKRLVATYDDFYKAASIYAPRRSMNSTKLSEGPQKVLDYLMCNYDQDYTQKELVEKLKCNQGNLSRWLETLKEMSLVTEDKGVRQKDTGEKDSYGAPLIRSTFPNVYQYKGEPIVGKITDTPLQLSEKERSKPEYIAWKEAKV